MSDLTTAEPGTRRGYPVCTRSEAAALRRAEAALEAIASRLQTIDHTAEPLAERWAGLVGRSADVAGRAVSDVLIELAVYFDSPQARRVDGVHDGRA